MNDLDTRWQQRAGNFYKAFARLQYVVGLAQQRTLSEVEAEGLIKRFEYTHELAWNTLKDYFRAGGATRIRGSIDATRLAFQEGLLENGDIWMDMIRSRNQSVHTYNKEIAEEIAVKILENYYTELQNLYKKLQQLEKEES